MSSHKYKELSLFKTRNEINLKIYELKKELLMLKIKLKSSKLKKTYLFCYKKRYIAKLQFKRASLKN